MLVVIPAVRLPPTFTVPESKITPLLKSVLADTSETSVMLSSTKKSSSLPPKRSSSDWAKREKVKIERNNIVSNSPPKNNLESFIDSLNQEIIREIEDQLKFGDLIAKKTDEEKEKNIKIF